MKRGKKMNELLQNRWKMLTKEIVELATLIHGKPVNTYEYDSRTEEVIRLSFDYETNEWMCISNFSSDLECNERGEHPEIVVEKALNTLEEKLKKEKQAVEAGRYRLYGLEED